MSEPREPAVERFIEQMGVSLQEDGWSRIAGRMFAFFVVHHGPFSLADVADQLSISRASASTNARVLRGMGILERVARPGDRQDYYRLADDPYGRLLDGYLERMQKKCETIAGLEAQLPACVAGHAQRLADWRRFYEAAIDATRSLGERLREQTPSDG